MSENISQGPGSRDLVVISAIHHDTNRHMVGKSIAEIGEIWKHEPVDAAIRLLEEEDGAVSMIGHDMSPANVEMVLSHPLVMIGSDGLSMAPEGPAAEQLPHPRGHGPYPRVLGHYSRDRGIFDLATAIKKCTSMPADQVGLADRGRMAG